MSLCDNLSNKKNISTVFNKATESMLVHAQKLQIKQMLLNVLRNAIKYSPDKTTVTIELKKHNVLPRNVIITISDQGPGIPKGELENIFKSYYRLSRDNRIEGSGVAYLFADKFALNTVVLSLQIQMEKTEQPLKYLCQSSLVQTK